MKDDNEYAENRIDLARLSTVNRRIYDTQSRFLQEFEKCGTIKSAARAANVSRETIYQWQRADKLGFAGRFKSAQETFRESLEEIMFDRLRDPKTHPVLLIFALKGHWREKYGDAAMPVDDAAKDILAQLHKIQRERRQRHESERASKDTGGVLSEVDNILRSKRRQG